MPVLCLLIRSDIEVITGHVAANTMHGCVLCTLAMRSSVGVGCIDDYIGGCGFINGQQVSVFDDNSHGTHCAGTIGAVKNNFGISGVNQRVSIMACKFLDSNGVG